VSGYFCHFLAVTRSAILSCSVFGMMRRITTSPGSVYANRILPAANQRDVHDSTRLPSTYFHVAFLL